MEQNQNVVETPTEQQATNPAPEAPRKALHVIVTDLHNGTITRYDAPTMAAAIHQYRVEMDAMRTLRAFMELDQLNWLATYKVKGGQIRTVVISNGEKVLGRAAGVARFAREQRPVATPLPAGASA